MSEINSADYKLFWIGLYGTPVLWAGLLVMGVIMFKFQVRGQCILIRIEYHVARSILGHGVNKQAATRSSRLLSALQLLAVIFSVASGVLCWCFCMNSY